MTIEKLPSGKYRATIMKNGKRYRLIYDTKPSRRQAESDLYTLIAKTPDSPNHSMTFREAAEKYVDMKRNVLSPSTLRVYAKYCQWMPEWFPGLQIDEISQVEINKVINEMASDRSPKTVRNYHGFISAVLATFRPQLKIYTTLPQKRRHEPHIPSDEDVKRLLTALRETEFYIPVILACYGMRRGEICALTPDDIEGDTVHIKKSVAYGEGNKKIIKSTKTTESERDIIIPIEIADQIRTQGYVYNGHPNSITRHMQIVEKQLGIEEFTLHKLRHYFASKMLTITDSKTVQALGVWKTDNVMKTVYAHSMKEEQEKAKRAAVEKLSGSIFLKISWAICGQFFIKNGYIL